MICEGISSASTDEDRSSPPPHCRPRNADRRLGRVAQLAEHSTLNRQVEGSIPSASTNILNSALYPNQKFGNCRTEPQPLSTSRMRCRGFGEAFTSRQPLAKALQPRCKTNEKQ